MGSNEKDEKSPITTNTPLSHEPSVKPVSPSSVVFGPPNTEQQRQEKEEEEEEYRRRRLRLWMGGCMAGGTVVACLALTTPFVTSMMKSPLPYMATPGFKIRRALDFVVSSSSLQTPCSATRTTKMTTTKQQQRHQQQQRRVFVDLGSGDGEGVYQALLAGYDSAIGVELNWTLYLLSQGRRILCWTRDQRHRSQFYHGNFFHASLPKLVEQQQQQQQQHSSTRFSTPHDHKEDSLWTVMIFGVTPLMPRFSRMLAHVCPTGTHILAYRFDLPLQPTTPPTTTSTAATTNHPEEQLPDNINNDTRSTITMNQQTNPLITTEDDSANHYTTGPLLRATRVYDAQEMRVYRKL